MRLLFLFLLLGLISQGCVTNVAQETTSHFGTQEDVNQLDLACDEISHKGNMIELLSAIKKDKNRILDYLEFNQDEFCEREITRIAERIKLNADKVIQLSKEEWNTPAPEYEYIWTIPLKKIIGVKILGVYRQGQERTHLKPLVTFSQGEDALRVTLRRIGTVMEYCQFDQTLMIALEVSYSWMKTTRIKFLNLIVKSGDV